LSIATPDDAIPVRTLLSEANAHREQNTPIKALTDLLNYLKQIKVDTLLVQGEHLRPMFVDAIAQIEKYIKVIDENAKEE
jgi:type VI protein secretion system component VasF